MNTVNAIGQEIKQFCTEIAGRKLVVEVGRLGHLANAACTVSYGDTFVFVSVCASEKPKEGVDFFPLSVDFEEKLYSVGKIPGGFIKREGKPSEKSILTARLIDRPIRPLFPDNYLNDVQIVAQVLSVEQDNTPDMVAMIGASLALSISDIPFLGPIAGVNMGYKDGRFIVNPTVEESENSDLHLAVAGTKDAINMVEAGANVLKEEIMLEALFKAHEEIIKICEFIEGVQKQIGKPKKEVPEAKSYLELEEFIKTYEPKIDEFLRIIDKQERHLKIENLKEEILEIATEKYPDLVDKFEFKFKALEKEIFRRMILVEGRRADGRTETEIRNITVDVGLLPRTHGSALFSRGLTQALTITTIGALGEAQRIDGLGLEDNKRYMHHYNFPPFSVGEVGAMRGPNRRAIGHGALAERALLPVLPSEEEFPYAIRLVSEIMACNGSSSQASICGSSLSLMDAGVPIKDAVAGIAMGLIKGEDKIAILSDIQGLEDALGDMDFKVAGTKDGITAMQMDIKIEGLPREILIKAMEQARVGRLHILSKMNEVISKSRDDLSKYAPRAFSMQINPEKIKDVIGTGGKTINKIIEETNVKIDIDDNGLVIITAPDGDSGKRAMDIIKSITVEVEVGQVFDVKIVKIMKFGVFVDLGNGKEGLIHISKLTKERLEKVEDQFKLGDIIKAQVIEIDKQGKINLSRAVLL